MEQKISLKNPAQVSHKNFDAITCLEQKIETIVAQTQIKHKENKSIKNLFKLDNKKFELPLKKAGILKKIEKLINKNVETISSKLEDEIVLLAEQQSISVPLDEPSKISVSSQVKRKSEQLEASKKDRENIELHYLNQSTRYSPTFFSPSLSKTKRQEEIADRIYARLERCHINF